MSELVVVQCVACKHYSAREEQEDVRNYRVWIVIQIFGLVIYECPYCGNIQSLKFASFRVLN